MFYYKMSAPQCQVKAAERMTYMKGYLIFAVAVAAIVLMLPPLFVEVPTMGQPTAQPSGTVQKDTFTVAHTDGGGTSTVSAFDLTLYATAASIAPDAPIEAVKAQAVACYTSFCYERSTKGTSEADVRTTPLPFPQAFSAEYWKAQWGDAYDTNMAVYRTAVEAVKNKAVYYDNKPIMALYHALNTGKTEDGAVLLGSQLPYLISVASPADALCEQQLKTVTFSVEEAIPLVKALCGDAVTEDAAAWFGEVTKTDAGTVTSVAVCGKSLTGAQVQQAFSLPSASFEVTVQEGQVLFTVHGSGHFVGLSQYGAIDMANDGQTYDAILKHYYQGTVVR